MSTIDTGSRAPAAVRVMIIVARDRSGLYDYLRGAFAGFEEIDVIIDRRIASDDGHADTVETLAGRRWDPDVYDELTLRGFVIKRIE